MLFRSQESVRNYYRLITEVDTVVGRIRERLERTGTASNTVIAFIGDNGFYLAEHGLAGRRSEAERAEAARAKMHEAYLSAPRTSAPIIPTALELKRLHEERLDKIDRASRRHRGDST